MIPAGARPAVVVVIALLTIAAVIVRPRRLAEGASALGGALLMIVLGLVTPAHAVASVTANWNVLLFFVGLMAVAGLAEEAGIFAAIAAATLRAGGGSPGRLLLATCLTGCVVTAFLSNDATALILTPVVALSARRAGLNPVPFALATSYVADAASGLLPVANPVNILTIDSFHLDLGLYLRVLLLPAVLVALVTVGAAMVALRSQLTPEPTAEADSVPPAAEHRLLPAGVVLVALGVGYVAATALRASTGAVAILGAAALALVVGYGNPARLRRVRTDVSWSVIAFVAALFVIVRALDDSGVTGALLHAWLGRGPPRGTTTVIAYLGSAAGSNVINNLPMTVLTLSGLHTIGAGALPALGAALGADVGPNLTPIGSLATLLWLVLLRARGITVSARIYMRYGLLVGLPGIAVGALGLLLTAR